MDRIIFDNVHRGFPANEKFMQMVDKNRLALLEVCRGIFGNRPTILTGVKTTITPPSGHGVSRVDISSGVLWTGSDLVYIKESQTQTDDPDNTLTVVITNNEEKGRFHDGSEYNAYLRNEGYVTARELPPAEMLLRNYIRAQVLQPAVSKIVPADLSRTGLNIKGSLQQTVYSDGRVNIRGTVAALDFTHRETSSLTGTMVAQLPIRNADIDSKISSNSTRKGNVYPAAITIETSRSFANEGVVSFAHFVKMTSDGGLYIHIPYDKIDPSVANGGGLWDAYITVDFTYNSQK